MKEVYYHEPGCEFLSWRIKNYFSQNDSFFDFQNFFIMFNNFSWGSFFDENTVKFSLKDSDACISMAIIAKNCTHKLSAKKSAKWAKNVRFPLRQNDFFRPPKLRLYASLFHQNTICGPSVPIC